MVIELDVFQPVIIPPPMNPLPPGEGKGINWRGQGGRVKNHFKQLSRITSNTPSIFFKTSLFQNLTTLNPFSERNLSLSVSLCFFLSMLSAIQFNYQPFLKTDRINNKILEGLLSSELYPVQSPGPESLL